MHVFKTYKVHVKRATLNYTKSAWKREHSKTRMIYCYDGMPLCKSEDQPSKISILDIQIQIQIYSPAWNLNLNKI